MDLSPGPSLSRPEWPLHWIYPLGGVVLSIATAIGFLAFRCIHIGANLSRDWIAGEVHSQGATYVYFVASTMALLVTLGAILGRKEEQLLASSNTDPGTSLWNRRHLEERLPRELACASHCGTALALLMVDVDRLKSINDRLGHEAGDAALQLVAESLRRTCRSRDLAVRWGGDEFVVLVPGTNAEQALTLAERIRTTLRQLASNDRSPAALSVSIGISELGLIGTTNSADLFASADRALYCAKEQGRDRVFVARQSWTRKTMPLKTALKEDLHVHA